MFAEFLFWRRACLIRNLQAHVKSRFVPMAYSSFQPIDGERVEGACPVKEIVVSNSSANG